jgi:hypothetical protein
MNECGWIQRCRQSHEHMNVVEFKGVDNLMSIW